MIQNRFFLFPTITDTPKKQGMEDILANLRKHFLSLPQNALKKIYRMHAERMRMLMINRMPVDIENLREGDIFKVKDNG